MKKNRVAICAALAVGIGAVNLVQANVLRDDGASTISSTGSGAPGGIGRQTLLPGGIGHQLIIPYYNVQAGNATLINLVNTDSTNGKAVKVRFRGASNSDDVYDFQVYMSPGDVWSANISRGANGLATLTTNDRSCTIPQVVSGSFVTARLNPRLTGDALAAETREGYVEIFNMADIPPFGINLAGAGPAAVGGQGTGPGVAPFGAPLATANALFTTTKHVGGVAPCFNTTAGAAALNALQNDPADIGAAYALGFRAPSASLYANWTIINVPKSGASSGEAIALAVTTVVGGANTFGNLVFFPQTGAPAATPDNFTADPLLRTTTVGINGVQNGANAPYAGGTVPIVVASNFDLPDLSTPYFAVSTPSVANFPRQQAELLTKQLATLNVINEYITDPAIGAFTDWVFSMPTRRYSVALDYRAVAPAPFTMAYTRFDGRDYFTAANTSVNSNQICVSTSGLTYYDREETTLVGNNFVISPNPPAAGFRLCGEVSVLTFNAPGGQSVLGAEIARTDFSTGTIRDGWANVATPGVFTGNGLFPADFGVVGVAGGHGLPIIGRAFTRAGNGTVSANFGAAWEHRYVRPIQ